MAPLVSCSSLLWLWLASDKNNTHTKRSTVEHYEIKEVSQIYLHKVSPSQTSLKSWKYRNFMSWQMLSLIYFEIVWIYRRCTVLSPAQYIFCTQRTQAAAASGDYRTQASVSQQSDTRSIFWALHCFEVNFENNFENNDVTTSRASIDCIDFY